MQQCNVLPRAVTADRAHFNKMGQIARQPSSIRLRPACLAR